MKKQFLSLAAILALAGAASLLLAPPVAAQTLPFDRAMTCGSGDGDFGWGPRGQAFDGAGNLYVYGRFTGTILLGNALLTAPPATAQQAAIPDHFIAKLDPAGRYLWAMQLGDNATQTTWVQNLAVDAQGSVYIAGGFDSYRTTLGTGGPTLFNASQFSDAFVARLDGATGRVAWARWAGGTMNDRFERLMADPAGGVYAVCQSNSLTLDFGPFALTSPTSTGPYGGNQPYLAKLNAAGAWQWAQPLGRGEGRVTGMVRDAQGDLFLAGILENALSFGTTRLYSNVIPGRGLLTGSDAFVVKTTGTGNVVWAVQADATTHNNLMSAAAVDLTNDASGHLYLTGNYEYTSARFGTTVLPNLSDPQPPGNPQSPPTPSYYYDDAFVARLNAATGAWEWAVRTGGRGTDYAYCPLLDSQGRLFAITASVDLVRPAFLASLAQLDPATGRWLGTRPLPAPGGATLDAQDRLNFLGYFGTTATAFGPFVLQPDAPTRGTGYLARMAAGPLAAKLPQDPGPRLSVWPNPAPGGAAWVQGPAPGQAVDVFDVLGRRVGGGPVLASGRLRLAFDGPLPAGLYLVRGGGQTGRLVVE